MAERLDGLDRFFRPILLLHLDFHIFQGIVHSISCVNGGPKQRDGSVGVLVNELDVFSFDIRSVSNGGLVDDMEGIRASRGVGRFESKA